MKKQQFKTKSLVFLFYLLRKISREKRRDFLTKIGKLILFFSKKTRQRVLDNIQRAIPDMDKADVKKLAFNAYGNCAFGVAESFWLDEIEPKIFCDEKTLSILQSGGGACIATMHLGCYEAVPVAVAILSNNSVTLSNIPTFVEEGLLFYAKVGVTAINKKTPQAFMQLIKSAKDNGYISLHCDLWGDEVEVDFFNQKTKAPAGVALLSKLAVKPILIGYSVYSTKENIKVFVETLFENTDDESLSVEDIMASIYQRFEQIIKQYPEQWYWSYKRWRNW
ncbi:lipid A biosynthesis lauroyl acyltransferase [Thalassotalea insulae]|uniref:Lipid A biosynthesis lauroyl acyltransferase n=1 Tax=Thalassotalea insulae TaxID=2056778 RepID=A0ABQ6GUK2_9GAMM|nr:lipid A biosynthesis acyltransferase [Thalassotalea insulae]GLX77841.1 lipid A biosynthesis lauroyl acyltransferase [Thalassotalea insulae]